jgi:hypothetical protein
MPRGTGPTIEELEFVFGCFARGLETSVVLEEIEGTEFPKRDPRKIGRYRLYWDVARQVILRRELTVADPIIARAMQQHYEDINNGLQLLKIYLEPLAGEGPEGEISAWEPQPMDKIRADDLLEHVADPALNKAVKRAITDGPEAERRVASRIALDSLREILAMRLVGGNCRHCPNPLEP